MGRQLELFGEGPAGGGVGPAAVGEDLGRLAGALPRSCRLGTSSWSFPGWRGLVYDREATAGRLAREGLAAYARHPLLRAVGIDRTFYASLGADAFAGYAAQVPADFRFLVKAASACTTPRERDSRADNPRFLDSTHAAAEVVAPCVTGLGDRLGAIVFQFPPLGTVITAAPERFAARLGEFLTGLPRGPRYAVELRDRELVTDGYFDALCAAGASHCFSVHPRMPDLATQRACAGSRAADPLIVRWMLHTGLRYEQALERYAPFSRIVDEDPATRESLADLCAEATLAGRTVLITANNKAEGSAPLTVFKLAESVVRRL
jgi:uncharacterized protein YecE (DUF72 family)